MNTQHISILSSNQWHQLHTLSTYAINAQHDIENGCTYNFAAKLVREYGHSDLADAIVRTTAIRMDLNDGVPVLNLLVVAMEGKVEWYLNIALSVDKDNEVILQLPKGYTFDK